MDEQTRNGFGIPYLGARPHAVVIYSKDWQELARCVIAGSPVYPWMQTDGSYALSGPILHTGVAARARLILSNGGIYEGSVSRTLQGGNVELNDVNLLYGDFVNIDRLDVFYEENAPRMYQDKSESWWHRLRRLLNDYYTRIFS